ncbi:lytic transglycosylase domain-containing protein [Alicyclobacillus sp. SO9]|uniref:lytic transglycosylase domain-containing protein n=1 Tax=Alicyclobacillus sp. SO9 TaxID=2665646 RepID=UPI001E29184D|nr:lytic transglycosylase domain-containing protein [Alicyclobacillus sp. SO9]
MKQFFGVLLMGMCLAFLVSGITTSEHAQAIAVKPQPLTVTDGQPHYLASRLVNPLVNPLSQPVAITKTIAMPAQGPAFGNPYGTTHTSSEINKKLTAHFATATGQSSATQQSNSASSNSASSKKAANQSNKSTSKAKPQHKSKVKPTLTPRMTVPSQLIPIYKGAGKRYSIPWTVLAAIHDVETHFAVSHFPVSSAGARGPMQFMPAVFAKYGVTAPGQHGNPNILNVPDAVYSAAHMLAQDGYHNSPSRAVYLYNHSWGYVHRVLYLAGLH